MSDKAWNSTLQRKTPLRRAKPREWKKATALKRTPLKRVNKATAKRKVEYLAARERYLREHSVCVACVIRGGEPGVASQIHHHRGRIGRLLCDERFWIEVCAPCHDWIHSHPAMARKLDLLSPASEFNVFPE